MKTENIELLAITEATSPTRPAVHPLLYCHRDKYFPGFFHGAAGAEDGIKNFL